MTRQTKEKAFEDAIIDSLLVNGGYQLGNAANFDRELALDKTTLWQFIQTSQPESWQKLAAIHGSTVEQKFGDRLSQELENRGMLDVLRYSEGMKFCVLTATPMYNTYKEIIFMH